MALDGGTLMITNAPQGHRRGWWGYSRRSLLAVLGLTILAGAGILSPLTHAALPNATGANSEWSLVSGAGSPAFESLAFASTDGRTVLAGSYDLGLLRSTDGGVHWSTVLQAPIATVASSGADPRIVYVGTWSRGVFYSADAGASWVNRSGGLAAEDVYALALDGQDSSIVLAGTERGVFKTSDRGGSWVASADGLGDGSVHSLLQAGGLWLAGTDWGVYRSNDGGVHWTSASVGLAGMRVLALVAAGDGKVWAGTDSGACFSADRGASWQAAGRGLSNRPVWGLAAHPDRPQELFAATSQGVFATGTGGASWSAFNEGLTGRALQVKALLLGTHAESDELWAATGAGLWLRELQPVSAELVALLPIIRRRYGAVPGPTTTPVQPTPSATATQPGTLYSDDFSNPNSGWYVGETATGRYGYVSGEYEITLKTQDGSTRLNAPGVQVQDAMVELDARFVTTGTAACGIVFSVSDAGDYYLFRVSNTRQYQLWRVRGGSWTALVDWTSSPYLHAGLESNRLRVARRGAEIVLYANDEHLVTLSDSELSGEGRVGLYARTWATVPMSVRFDNFSVYASDGVHPTATRSVTPLPTVSRTASRTASPVQTATQSSTPSATRTQSATPTATRTRTATLTATPTRTATQTATATASYLLFDDFSNAASGWPNAYVDTFCERTYADGEYHILAKSDGIIVASYPQSFDNFEVEVQMRRLAGPTGGRYGLLLRHFPTTDYLGIEYFYYVWLNPSSGTYAVWRWHSGWTVLRGETASAAIGRGNATNTLRVSCRGTAIKVSVNGTILSTVSDSALSSGYLGLTASGNGMHVHFDNLAVLR